MPYRIHVRDADDDVLDRLVDLGALDAERTGDGLVVLLPDAVTPAEVTVTLERGDFTISEAVGRDEGSVWILGPRAFRVGRVSIAPADGDADPGALRLADASAFGTGLHPTTALCLDALQEIVDADLPDRVLDVGTGSGILALAALRLGVARATAIDIDPEAIRVAGQNARLNALSARLELSTGGPETLDGSWPLVLANVVAAPLIEMAPLMVRRVGHHGRLVLSGIPRSVEEDVVRAYRRLGMRHLTTASRGDWIAIQLQASW